VKLRPPRERKLIAPADAGVEGRLSIGYRGAEPSTPRYVGSARLPTYVDDTALQHDTVFVSAGRRGLEIELAPRDLLELTRAEVRPLRRAPTG
jgi:hypothetical protein